MINLGKYRILQSRITACDYEYIIRRIDQSTQNNSSLLVSPVASHTLVKARYDSALEKKLNAFDELVTDSHWVKWALEYIYGIRIEKRVYGPTLMQLICKHAEETNFKLFLYGCKKHVLLKLKKTLLDTFPALSIVGMEPSNYKTLSAYEWSTLVRKIIASRATIIFLGLGSPRQEIFAIELKVRLGQKKKKMAIIPVGAAFDFLAKEKPVAPVFIQERGFEWLFRFLIEPKRLFIRYFIYGPIFLVLIHLQKRKTH